MHKTINKIYCHSEETAIPNGMLYQRNILMGERTLCERTDANKYIEGANGSFTFLILWRENLIPYLC